VDRQHDGQVRRYLLDVLDDQVRAVEMRHIWPACRVVHRVGQVTHEHDILAVLAQLPQAERPTEHAHVRMDANDDHVLLGSPSSSFTAHPYVVPNLPYKQNDLAPIARGWNVIIVVAVPAALPVNSLDDRGNMSRAQPGKLNWAGVTGANEFMFAGWLKHDGLNMTKVAYKNPVDAAIDLNARHG